MKGLYSAPLGDASIITMHLMPGSIFTRPDVRLRVWFNDGTHGSQLIAPDQRIAAVAYAMSAGRAGTVYGDGSAGNFTAPPGGAILEVSNPQFDHFTIPSGSTLHVPSGITIRCLNAFTNNGTMIVEPSGGLTPVLW